MNLSLYRYAIYDFNRIEVPAYCQLRNNFYVHIQMHNDTSSLKRRMTVRPLLFLFTYAY
jgi:hypothetical protein